MIFGNLRTIVDDHYTSLASETGLKYPFDYSFIVFIFGIVPIVLAFILAFKVPLWSGFIAASAPILSVLTGFSINTLVLLMRYTNEESHPYEQRTIKKTKEFTLYTILIGVVIIISLVFGFILVQIDLAASRNLSIIVSATVYALMGHYFITLLVITHRLWALIHGDAV